MPSLSFQERVRPFQLVAIACGMALLLSASVHAQEEVTAAKPEMLLEWDPYYSDVSYNIPLTQKPVPTITSRSESVFLRELLHESLIPQYMLLEASVYPMPVLGTYLKTHRTGFYNSGDIGNNLNIIESLTAGFQEPWAVSMFFGNVAKLKRPGDKGESNNYGYTGYLFSAGAKHIKNNTLVDDNWCEFEWKIKGKIDRQDEKLAWSFRVGGKFNANHEVNNVTYIKLHRSNTDFAAHYLAWLENSNFDFSLHFLQHTGQLVRSELIVGKKMPLLGRSYIPTFSIGFIWSSPDEYSGALRNETANKMMLVIRPSIEF
ncbi:MAG: hypothetical protein PHQ60_07055 [Sideroxydans sp.]|nr:hypothetical protein [Sideroxydans sp.]